MARNKIPLCNIVSIVRINGLLITPVLIMLCHWYVIISRKWRMINAKYLSSDSFLIWNNAKVYCCSHFRCHIYKYLLNIRTILEGWKIFWWVLAGKRPFCIMMVTWLKYSLLIGRLSLFIVNQNTWSCLYGGFLSLSYLFVSWLCFLHFMLILWYKYGFHINCNHTLLKELYVIFGNLLLPLSIHCWMWDADLLHEQH